MSREDPTPEEVDAILAYQHGAYGVNLPDWYLSTSDYKPKSSVAKTSTQPNATPHP